MINSLLEYNFLFVDSFINPITKKVVPVYNISQNNNNYKKDSFNKKQKDCSYYGKKRRSYIDYC